MDFEEAVLVGTANWLFPKPPSTDTSAWKSATDPDAMCSVTSYRPGGMFKHSAIPIVCAKLPGRKRR
jgi:hypothetical protein